MSGKKLSQTGVIQRVLCTANIYNIHEKETNNQIQKKLLPDQKAGYY